MANFSAAAIQAAVAEIKKAMGGVDISYESGAWFITANGKKQPVDPTTASGFDDVLADAAVKIGAKNVKPVNPGGASKWNPYISAQRQAAGAASAQAAQNAATQAVIDANGTQGGGQSGGWWNRVMRGRSVSMMARRGLAATLAGDSMNLYAGAALAGTAAAGIHQSGALGERAAQGIVEGGASVINGAYGAGAKIGNAILSSALQPFGKSGSAVSQFAGQLTQTLGSALSGSLNILGKIAGVGGKILGTGVGLATTGIGALAGGLLGAGPGILVGAAIGSLVGAALMKVTEAIANGISSALGAIGAAFGAFGDVVTGALKTISDVLSDVTSSAQKYAQQILSLSHQSGASLGASQSAINIATSLGVNPNDVEALKRPRFIQSLRQSAVGIQGEPGSREALESFFTRFRALADQGGVGLIRAQALARISGYEKYTDAAYFSPQLRAQQYGRTAQMQGAFGMNSDQIAEAGQKFTALSASVGQFAEMVKVKIGSELFPFLNAGLNKAIAYVSAHAGDIAAGIKRGVSWLVDTLPVLLLSSASFVLGGMQKFTGWISANASGILRFFDSIINGFRGVFNVMNALINSLGHDTGIHTKAQLQAAIGKPSHLVDDAQGLQDFFNRQSAGIGNAKASVDSLLQTTQSGGAMAIFNDIAASTKATAQNTDKIARLQDRAASGDGSASKLLALMDAYFAADTVRANARP